MVIMIAFYNNHMNFYSNYGSMIGRWIYVCWVKFLWRWPPLPSIVVSLPLLARIIQLGYWSFTNRRSEASPTSKKGDGNNEDAKK